MERSLDQLKSLLIRTLIGLRRGILHIVLPVLSSITLLDLLFYFIVIFIEIFCFHHCEHIVFLSSIKIFGEITTNLHVV